MLNTPLSMYCNCIAKGGRGWQSIALLGFHQLRLAVEENLKALNELTPQSAAIKPRLAVAWVCVGVCVATT